MKKFNLEDALNGKKVVTRAGVDVKDICFFKQNIERPVICLIDEEDCVTEYTKEGEFMSGSWSNNDLFMATVKKEAWINVYKDKLVTVLLHKTKELAEFYGDGVQITTIKIEWEE